MSRSPRGGGASAGAGGRRDRAGAVAGQRGLPRGEPPGGRAVAVERLLGVETEYALGISDARGAEQYEEPCPRVGKDRPAAVAMSMRRPSSLLTSTTPTPRSFRASWLGADFPPTRTVPFGGHTFAVKTSYPNPVDPGPCSFRIATTTCRCKPMSGETRPARRRGVPLF